MTSYPRIVALVCGMWATSYAGAGAAQTYERLQPIVLTPAPAPCQSPARIYQRPVTHQAYGDSYLSPSVSESIPSVITASELVPLPAGPIWRTYSTDAVIPAAYAAAVPSESPVQQVQVFRPVTDQSVPAGYVVGQGLMGQPKLYKPGQPMRNLLRYLSL